MRTRSLVCGRNHSFDIARQGYVNLLRRAAPPHADTPPMVAARHRFLDAGWFAPLTDAITTALSGTQRVLETGTGTGHYVSSYLCSAPTALALGTDISPAACRMAARRNNRLGVVVADTWERLPVRDGAVDAVLCVFAPRSPSEFARVLASGGRLVVVTPAPGHLMELRDRLGLLSLEAGKLQRLDQSLRGFDLNTRAEVRHELDLTEEAAADLIGMGPNAFHKRLSAAAIQTTAAFTVSQFRKG